MRVHSFTNKTGLSNILNTNIPNDGNKVVIGQNRFNGTDPQEVGLTPFPTHQGKVLLNLL